ncbi:hypothetical protein MPL1032_30411 [Mesorhizobium plurifarium]|uniref:Uncharacterized protein n=1 Tax=Mesorhizobium plurifarium TaxID=69974 RepID=A0A0K2W3J4_MESPL|nr:hypothetical protein MPL1032_30411 [Mesorhizobium plurifarium]
MLSFLLLTARWQFAPRKGDHQENQIPDPGHARNLISRGRVRPLITLAYQRWLEIAFPLLDTGGLPGLPGPHRCLRTVPNGGHDRPD